MAKARAVQSRRGRPRKVHPVGAPEPCECGRKGEYPVDGFGIVDGRWRCRDCHERETARQHRPNYCIRW